MSDSTIPPLRARNRSVSIELAAHLERLIATGKLEKGERLPPERQLASTLGVSRTSLREAMHELESKGLIERRQGIGTIVSRNSPEVSDLISLTDFDVRARHVLELRDVLEPEIAGFAAIRATPSNLLQLRDAIERLDAEVTRGEHIALDAEFHLLLSHAAQNPLFTSLGALSSHWTRDVREGTQTTAEGRRESAVEHRRIFEAIEAHDRSAAISAMKAHLRGVRRRVSPDDRTA